MKKELPKLKKSLKSFILDEDAKVIDRTATKVAITASFIAINMLVNTNDANAKGHKNHSNHQNNVNAPNDYGTGIHGGNNPTVAEVNEISPKSVETWHSNHYNHQDAGGGQGIMGMIAGAVAVAVAVAVGGAGLAGVGALLSGSFGLGASASFYGLAVAGAAVGGSLMSEDGEVVSIVTGAPHFIDEAILKILEEEED